jgi:hypothetical protein
MAICRQCHRKMGELQTAQAIMMNINQSGYSLQDPRSEVPAGGKCSE